MIRPTKTAVLIARRIVRDITERHLRPGDRIASERAMLDEYQVARGTLREALRYLEMQGVITMRLGPTGGPVVSSPTHRNLASTLTLCAHRTGGRFRDVLDTREILEPVMAARAAVHIDECGLEVLRDTIEQMESARGDVDAFLDQNRRFHETIASSSGNSLFGLLIESLHGITDGTALGVDYPTKHRDHVMRAHARILDGIERSDPYAAAAAMSQHLGEFSTYMWHRYPELMNHVLEWDVEALQ